MANDFKRFTKAGVSDNSGVSADLIYTVPAALDSSALQSIVIGISIANTTTSNRTLSVFLQNYDGINNVYIAKDLSIPANTTVELMSGNKLVLENNGSLGDTLRVSSDTASALDVVVSVLEDV
jgi:hypothetical protein